MCGCGLCTVSVCVCVYGVRLDAGWCSIFVCVWWVCCVVLFVVCYVRVLCVVCCVVCCVLCVVCCVLGVGCGVCGVCCGVWGVCCGVVGMCCVLGAVWCVLCVVGWCLWRCEMRGIYLPVRRLRELCIRVGCRVL